MIHYVIQATHPEAHLFTVSVTIPAPDPQGQVFALPVWIPGSYMVREFARHIVRIEAHANGKKIALQKYDKHRWQAAPCKGSLTVEYDVYAWDLSVRAAHLDTTHGFFNGTSVFLQVVGQTAEPCAIEIVRPKGAHYKNWRVATSLPEAKGKGGAKRYGFGRYQAENYDALVDHPVEMGNFTLGTFEACGVAHDVVITGYVPNLDMPRLLADLQPICEAQIKLFEPKTAQAPMARYVFMTQVTTDGYGGLEHRASTALMCGRNDLPVLGKPEMTDGYQTYLGLCSHEYFHTWNVKRIKPAAFAPYDYAQENYTQLLWLFEGFTSYYDDLMLVRTGRITPDAYLKLLEKNLNAVLRGSGRTKQSVAESSFDAWTKYYRQDENAPNAIVSYYGKGALVALGLDAKIRTETRGKKSLDDVMRLLWQRYGRDFYTTPTPQGLAEDGFAEVVVKALGKAASPSLVEWLNRYLRDCVLGTADVPLAMLLTPLGVAMQFTNSVERVDLGVKTSDAQGWLKITQVLDGGAAQAGGLAAGDVLIALDSVRVLPNTLDKCLSRYCAGDSVVVHYARHDIVAASTLRLQLSTPAVNLIWKNPSQSPQTLQRDWLGQPATRR